MKAVALHFLLVLPFLTCHLAAVIEKAASSPATGPLAPPQEDEVHYLPHSKYYHTLDHVHKFLRSLQKTAHPYMRILHTYQSTQGREIPLFIVNNFSDNSPQTATSRQRVLLVFGAHGREFLPVESALHWLANLSLSLLPNSTHSTLSELTQPLQQQRRQAMTSTTSSNFAHFLLRHFSVYLLPLWNPDGRARVEKEKEFCWRGTSNGVDLDRNFPWNFVSQNRTVNNAAGIAETEVPGASAFSETESRVVRDLMDANDFNAVVHFSSGGFRIVCPYADSISMGPAHLQPPHLSSILNLASNMANQLHTRMKETGDLLPPKMETGEARNLLGTPQDGALMDYATGLLKVPFAMNVFLWSSSTGPEANTQGRTTQQLQKSCFSAFNPANIFLYQTLEGLLPLYVSLFQGLHQLQLGKPGAPKGVLADEASTTDSLSQALLFMLRTMFYITVVLSLVGVLLLRKYWPKVKYYFRGRRIVNTRNFGTHYFNYMKYM